MKMTVLYYSKSGNTEKMANMIAEGMNCVEGAEAKAFSIDAVDLDWAKESRCIVLGTPTYMADVAGVTKTYLESGLRQCEPAGKIGGAFATARYIYGGGEIGLQTILTHMMVSGMLTYSGGGALGMPVIHLGPVAIGDRLEESEETFRIYGQRMAQKAAELFK